MAQASYVVERFPKSYKAVSPIAPFPKSPKVRRGGCTSDVCFFLHSATRSGLRMHGVRLNFGRPPRICPTVCGVAMAAVQLANAARGLASWLAMEALHPATFGHDFDNRAIRCIAGNSDCCISEMPQTDVLDSPNAEIRSSAQNLPNR